MSVVADHPFGHADARRHVLAPLVPPRHHQRLGLVLHGVQVKKMINGFKDRPNYACPTQFDAVAIAVQNILVPHTVEIFIDIA